MEKYIAGLFTMNLKPDIRMLKTLMGISQRLLVSGVVCRKNITLMQDA